MGCYFVRLHFCVCLRFDGICAVNEVASLHKLPEIGRSLLSTLIAKCMLGTDACWGVPPLYCSVDIATDAVYGN